MGCLFCAIIASIWMFVMVWQVSIDMEPHASEYWRCIYSLLWTCIYLLVSYIPGYGIGFLLSGRTKVRTVIAVILLAMLICFLAALCFFGELEWPLNLALLSIFGLLISCYSGSFTTNQMSLKYEMRFHHSGGRLYVNAYRSADLRQMMVSCPLVCGKPAQYFRHFENFGKYGTLERIMIKHDKMKADEMTRYALAVKAEHGVFCCINHVQLEPGKSFDDFNGLTIREEGDGIAITDGCSTYILKSLAEAAEAGKRVIMGPGVAPAGDASCGFEVFYFMDDESGQSLTPFKLWSSNQSSTQDACDCSEL